MKPKHLKEVRWTGKIRWNYDWSSGIAIRLELETVHKTHSKNRNLSITGSYSVYHFRQNWSFFRRRYWRRARSRKCGNGPLGHKTWVIDNEPVAGIDFTWKKYQAATVTVKAIGNNFILSYLKSICEMKVIVAHPVGLWWWYDIDDSYNTIFLTIYYCI